MVQYVPGELGGNLETPGKALVLCGPALLFSPLVPAYSLVCVRVRVSVGERETHKGIKLRKKEKEPFHWSAANVSAQLFPGGERMSMAGARIVHDRLQ